ncbi:MAG: hypothetical protein L0Y42_15305 [Phycisphaerales bacterium]|nr:hypothetical protein [Phycisphaerales bacterium]
MNGRKHIKMARSFSLALAGLAALEGAVSVCTAQVVNLVEHRSLGFNASFAVTVGDSDGGDLCPLVPPPAPAGGSYSYSFTGGGTVIVDLGADFTVSYNRADLIPGAALPLTFIYTPTNDGGPEVDKNISATVEASAEIEICLLPNPSGSVGPFSFTLAQGTADFIAPLGADAPAVVPRASDSFLFEVAGIDVFTAQVVGSVALAPLGPGAFPGLGGAAAMIDVSGPATLTTPIPLIPLVEWQAAGQSVPGEVAISNSVPLGSTIDVTYGPVMHWLTLSAEYSLVIDLATFWNDVGISDPDPIPLFSGNLGSVFTGAGLDCIIGSAIDGGPCGGLIGSQVAGQVAGGSLPFPLLSPEIAPLSIGGPVPTLGTILFSIDPDADNDNLLDGEEINIGTDPDDPDTDDDLIDDGTEVQGNNPTDPLDDDSDDDLLEDGFEDANQNGQIDSGETDPNDADSDDDGLTDGEEVLIYGTDPLDPDTDDDELPDGIEVDNGTDPLDEDTDNDGILDGEDVEFLQNALNNLPDSAFQNGLPGLRNALLTHLEAVEARVASGQIAQAVRLLSSMRMRVDGCGVGPDPNDWIVDCPSQIQIRDFIDLLITNLTN